MFIGTGSVIVGYEINKVKKYAIKFDNYCVIGCYEISHSRRSAFIYTALTAVHGYSIRKENWVELLDNNEEIAVSIMKNSLD